MNTNENKSAADKLLEKAKDKIVELAVTAALGVSMSIFVIVWGWIKELPLPCIVFGALLAFAASPGLAALSLFGFEKLKNMMRKHLEIKYDQSTNLVGGETGIQARIKIRNRNGSA